MSTPDSTGEHDAPAESATATGPGSETAATGDTATSTDDGPEAASEDGAGTPEGAGRTWASAESGAPESAAPDTADEGGEEPGDRPGETDDGGTESGSTGSVFDFVPSPVFVLVLGLTGLAGWLSWTRAELSWGGDGSTVYLPAVFILGGWIVSLALHEFAHAIVGYHSGDRALRGTGYLTLNPFRFRELFAGLLMPVAFLALGALGLTGPALYLDTDAVPSRARRTLTALAGIVMSLLVAAAFAVAVLLLVPAGAVTDNWMIGGLMFLCYLNLTTALVNVLPIPGLDGFAAIAPYLPAGLARHARTSGLFGVIAVFAVLWFPQVNLAFLDLMYNLLGAVGLGRLDIGFGQFLLQFWLG